MEQPAIREKGGGAGSNQERRKTPAAANKDTAEPKLPTKPERETQVGNTSVQAQVMWALGKREAREQARKQQGRAWADAACQGSASADL